MKKTVIAGVLLLMSAAFGAEEMGKVIQQPFSSKNSANCVFVKF